MEAICKQSCHPYRFSKGERYKVKERDHGYAVLNETSKTWYNFYRSDLKLPKENINSPKFADYFYTLEEWRDHQIHQILQ